jgi:hypothetical protein
VVAPQEAVKKGLVEHLNIVWDDQDTLLFVGSDTGDIKEDEEGLDEMDEVVVVIQHGPKESAP